MAHTHIRFTDETLRRASLFENLTKARVKDCIEHEGKLVFIVEPGDLGLAIGKGGENIRRLKSMLKRDIDIIGYSPDTDKFIRNIFHNYEILEVKVVTQEGKKTAYVSVKLKDKGRVIGKSGRNLRLAREIMCRHSDIENVIIA
jgi:N utilization substance protein A